MSMRARAPIKLDGLQAGRAIAALMVAIFHANVYVLPQKLYDGVSAARVFNLGYSGVEFFFVLSGFIMIFVHARDFDCPERAQSFLTKRALRIYPVYWLVLALLLMVVLAVPGLGSPSFRDPALLICSALLVPMTVPAALEVSWTLTHEMLFYLIFALLILKLSLGRIVLSLWMAGCVLMVLGGPFPFPLNVVFSPYNLLFSLGMMAAYHFRQVDVLQARLLLVAGAMLFFAVGLSEAVGDVRWNFSLRTVLYGIGAMLLVTGLAAGAARIPRVLVYLGDASFAIYLVHVPVMAVLARMARHLHLSALPPAIMLVLLVAGGALAGMIVHLAFERPLLSAAKRSRNPAPAAREP